ncbi:Arc family DNA-binding protein [Paraburkholderia mimosarum]|uniref:Arc family DNA-binding protein n=1 Tax=Paraburkholderia mimosarum TaxID=312026 RepID=UPI0039C39E37
MANQDDFIKTALRLPRELHTAIRAAAESASKSMNSEIIGRLHESLRTDEAGSILERLNSREAQLLEAKERQLGMLTEIVGRADEALARSAAALEGGGAGNVEKLLHEISVLRGLIHALGLQRSDHN